MTHPILKSSLKFFRYQAAKQRAEQDERDCQIYSDKKMLNRLDYTPTPKIPEVKPTKVAPLSAGIINMVRQFIP